MTGPSSSHRSLLAVVLGLGLVGVAVGVPAGTAATTAEPPPAYLLQWDAGQEPSAVAVHPASGAVHVVGWDDQVRIYSGTGVLQDTWTWDDDVPSGFSRGIAVDPDGNVYVSDVYGDVVRRFSPDGDLLTSWGGEGSGPGELQGPTGIDIDPATGEVYVADLGNNRVQVFTATGAFVREWSGGIRYPEDVAYDETTGDVYVVEASWDPHRVWRFTSDGTYVDEWGSIGSAPGELGNPTGVDVDAAGDVYVVEQSNRRVQKFAPDGTVLSLWGSAGSDPGEFASPTALAIDGAGDVYVADTDNGRVQKFGYRGRPDSAIRRGSGAFVGNDVYGTTGLDQTRSAAVKATRSVSFTVSVQNDARFAERIAVKGKAGTTRFRVVYLDPAGNRVTDRVVAGTYRTPLLAPGGASLLTVRVTVLKVAPVGAKLSRLVASTSTTDPSYVDAVRYVVRRA